MKIHHPKKTKSAASKTNTNQVKAHCLDDDLEKVAEELVDLARSRLPNGVMLGILYGSEEDIRQEAVLLALKWYIRGRTEETGSQEWDWNAPRAICSALRYSKLNAIGRHSQEQQARASWAKEYHQDHINDGLHRDEWSPAEIRQVIEKSIQQALKSGLISHANASIAIQIYIDGVTVVDLAERLNRTAGAIYQQLARVRQVIPEIIESIRQL